MVADRSHAGSMEAKMNSPTFSLQEDLHALAELLENVNAVTQLGSLLERIQTAPSRDHLTKWLEQVSGYLLALDDFALIDREQAILLRELVTRAHMRSPLS
jgi:HPt (histidine-containing phosphotransfer) domain-containing protein